MKVINLSENNTILNEFLAEIRDVEIQKDRMKFRENIRRIGHVMAYEISRELTYTKKRITTPLCETEVSVPADEIVLSTVFRAGLPLHQGFLDVFDKAGNAFVSAYRYYKDDNNTEIGVKIEYMATPSTEDKTLIIVDPMLATGGSMELAYKAFITKKLILACVIAAKDGIEILQKTFPNDDVTLYCAAIDPVLNEHKYIVPGLGDAGDLLYGEKV